MQRGSSLVYLAVLGLLAGGARPGLAGAAAALSPGSPDGFVNIGERCPTFSWGVAPGSGAYELEVFAVSGATTVPARAPEVEPLLRRTLAGSTHSWAPEGEACLDPGGHYAWTVRPVVGGVPAERSEPRLFRVRSEPWNRGSAASVTTPVPTPGRPTASTAAAASEPRGLSVQVNSYPGVAGHFQNSAPFGKILSGWDATQEVFSVDDRGSIKGANLTVANQVNASSGAASHFFIGDLTVQDLSCFYGECISTDEIADGSGSGLDADTLDGLDASALAPRREFYLTSAKYTPVNALTACATGFHFASLYEMLDPSHLIYDDNLGVTMDDSGRGPPPAAGVGPGTTPQLNWGWVRTGRVSYADTVGLPGGNCWTWTSDQEDEFGTIAGLQPDLGLASASPWVVSGARCNELWHVWCVSDVVPTSLMPNSP